MNHQDTEMQVVIVGAGRADLVAQTKVPIWWQGGFYPQNLGKMKPFWLYTLRSR